jgi:signal transduction histidine kinase
MTTPAAPADLVGLELLADAAVVIDGDGSIGYANGQAARLLGEPADALIGSDAEKKLRLRGPDGSDWWECADPMRADARLLPRIAEQELTLQVGPTARAVAVTGARIAGPDGGTARMVLTLRRAEARRLRDAARSDLVSTVSHELRSPLTSVKGFTKTLLVKWDRFTDEQKKQMLATVNEDADRVTRLLGELLSVSRIDAGRLQLKRQMVPLDVLLPRVVHRMEAAMPEARGRIDVAVDEVPELYADPDRLEQILVNLLENALKYTAGSVEVVVTDGEDVVRVTCTDHGDGIEPQFLGQLFTKFFRRPGEKRQGTGLGLYITKGLVEAHGGEIWVTSDPGVGTTFTFTVPKGGLELAGIDLDALRASSP